MDKKTDEIIDAKGGSAREVILEAAQRESPLDEARRLNRETKELTGTLEKLKNDLTELAAFSALSGRAGLTPKPIILTPEEEQKKQVQDLANRYLNAIK